MPQTPDPLQSNPTPCRFHLAPKLIPPLTAIFLAAAVIWSIITPAFLETQYAQLSPDSYGLTPNQRLDLARTAVFYLRLWSPPEKVLSLLSDQTLPDGRALYTPEELSHLVDVKYLTDTIRIIGMSTLAFLFICVIILYPPRPRRYILQRTAVGGLLLIPAAFILLLGVTMLWPLFFIKFHELLFTDGSWAFDETAGLIRLFPELFWFRVGQAILTRMLIAGTVTCFTCTATYLVLDYRQNRQENQTNRHKPPWRADYQQELRWLKLGLLTIIPNALMWYLLGFAVYSFRSSVGTSFLAVGTALCVGWFTSAAFDNTHHQRVENYDWLELNEYMISLFGLGMVMIGIGLISLGSSPLLAFLAPGIIISGIFILVLGSGQLIMEYLARRQILE